jgi:acyl-CoA synthetase (NDP forming)
MYASNGNACDVSIAEILRYWGDDEATRAVVLYTEGFADPREFLEVASDVAARKPVLAMKAGRTEQGAKAASSHTGSLAGVDITTELIFEKTGILSFQDEGELARCAGVCHQPILRGPRAIANTGGLAVSPPRQRRRCRQCRSSCAARCCRRRAHQRPTCRHCRAEHFRAALEVLQDDRHRRCT